MPLSFGSSEGPALELDAWAPSSGPRTAGFTGLTSTNVSVTVVHS